MEVSIYVKDDFGGRQKGSGEAAALIEYIDGKGGRHPRQRYIRTEHGTKNALILKICSAAVQVLLKPCDVTIYTDCGYVANAVRAGWMEAWEKNGWQKARGKPLANTEEWKQFCERTKMHKVRFETYDGQCEEELKEILESQGEVGKT